MWRLASLLCLVLLPTVCSAGGGPFGIDYQLHRSDNGIWNRSVQVGLEDGVIALDVGTALWLGNDNPLGHTFWQAADSMALSGISAQLLKYAFGRARPTQGNDPNAWFRGRGHQSFPSGEVVEQASFVTPFIVDYQRTQPWVWALEILPAYVSVARLKSQAHWQSDLIAGWLLGTGIGYLATKPHVPIFVQVLPGGVSVGLYKRF
jgi:membrane-associated phospholipid phosphatase